MGLKNNGIKKKGIMKKGFKKKGFKKKGFKKKGLMHGRKICQAAAPEVLLYSKEKY